MRSSWDNGIAGVLLVAFALATVWGLDVTEASADGIRPLDGVLPEDLVLVTRSDGAVVDGYGAASNEDLLMLHPTYRGTNLGNICYDTIWGGTWAQGLDGSARGIVAPHGIDALHVFGDGSFICSTKDPATVPYPGPGGTSYDDVDLIFYDAARGTWSKFFDGSDHGLTSSMNVIAASVWGNSLILSTYEGGVLGGVHYDAHDLVAFTPTTPGDFNGPGTWSLFLDGEDIVLEADWERIDALHVCYGYRPWQGATHPGYEPEPWPFPSADDDGEPTILFSVDDFSGYFGGGTKGYYVEYDDEDIVAFCPLSLGDNTTGYAYLWLDGDRADWHSYEDADWLDLGDPDAEINAFSLFQVPEPTTWLLLGSGLLSSLGLARRRTCR